MRRGFVVLLVAVVAALAAAELWLRARGFPQPPVAPAPPTRVAPDHPCAAPLLVVGGTFTAGEGLREGERWTHQLAARVAGATGFSEVLVGAPFADPGPIVEATLKALTRTSEPPSARGLNVVQHERGADVVVIEAGGDALGGDPSPFVIATSPAPATPSLTRHRLALLDWFDRWQQERALEAEQRAIDRLVATDGFVAGAAARARGRLEELTRAVSGRRLDEGETRFLRALITELHGLRRNEVRLRELADWRRLLGSLRMEQRATVLLLAGPSLTQVGLVQLAYDLAIPVVHAPAFDLDPRLRTHVGGERAAAAVHTEVADAIWAALTRRGVLPQVLNAPADVAESAERIESAAFARGGIDQALITLAQAWLTERVEFGAAAPPQALFGPPQALFGVGPRGRLAPGVAAELVLLRPPLPDELVVAATMKAGAGAPPRLKLRHESGDLLLEPRATRDGSSKDPGRIALEYRVAAPPSKEVVARPAYEFTVVTEAGAPDPQFELAVVELTRSSAPEDGK